MNEVPILAALVRGLTATITAVAESVIPPENALIKQQDLTLSGTNTAGQPNAGKTIEELRTAIAQAELLLANLGGLSNGAIIEVTQQQPQGLARKLLDTNVLIDGRILDVIGTGFIEGEILVPQCVIVEVQRQADNRDPLMRAKGRRALDILGELKEFPKTTIPYHHDTVQEPTTDDTLIHLARDLGATLVSLDSNLQKVALLHKVPFLNINELACALRPAVVRGEKLTLKIHERGQERGQGLGQLEDNTMVVVENAQHLIGRTVEIIVTTSLQNKVGRMIFGNVERVVEEQTSSETVAENSSPVNADSSTEQQSSFGAGLDLDPVPAHQSQDTH